MILSEPVQIALIVAVAPTATAICTFILGLVNHSKLEKVEEKVNGRLSELLQLTRKSSRAEGVKEGERR